MSYLNRYVAVIVGHQPNWLKFVYCDKLMVARVPCVGEEIVQTCRVKSCWPVNRYIDTLV